MAQTTRTDLKQEWLKLAPAWIKEAREGRNPTRNGLLDKPMLEACGDVRGLRVLDSGCGVLVRPYGCDQQTELGR